MSYIPRKQDEQKLARVLRKLRRNLKGLELKDVGSTAKGTWLRGHSDIDIYVICEDMEATYKRVKELYPEGHDKKGKLTIWNCLVDGFDVDLVIVTKDFEKREDTTQHVRYYNEHLTDEMRNEVRTAKAWFKTFGVYGAEIGGIVGVAIEQLVVHYKDFLTVCKVLADSRPYVQDPTMTARRDLLASIIPKRWKVIQGACKVYAEDPSIRFVYVPMDTQHFMETYPEHSTMMFRRKSDTGLDYQTITSTASKVSRILRNSERGVEVDHDAYVDSKRIVLCFKVRPLELSPTKEVCVELQYAEGFRDAHPDAYTKNGKVCAIVRRAVVFPDTFYTSKVARLMSQKGYEMI